MTKRNKKNITYKAAGVDIESGEALVDNIKSKVQSTHSPRVMGGYGGFAGLFRLDNNKLFAKQYKEPVLASCTDGVGTKLKIAFEMNVFNTIGIDLVAMNVNDLICCGADPLFFLDYLATGKLDPDQMTQAIDGIVKGCDLAGCSLLGGETAEMPGFYENGEFDMAGFSVGVVEKSKNIDGRNIKSGDIVVGLGSSGIHSNGYGLARKVIFDIAKMKITDSPDLLRGKTVGESMLEPTCIYSKSVIKTIDSYKTKSPIKAMSHITGGGLAGNVARVIPSGFTVKIENDTWPIPPIFELIAHHGPVDQLEMRRVFNMGIGLVLVVSPRNASSIVAKLSEHGERAFIIGKIKKGKKKVEWN